MSVDAETTAVPASQAPAAHDAAPAWTIEDAEALYRVREWSDRFFFVNERGHVSVRTARPEGPAIDVHELVEDLGRRGVRFPVLVRFHDVLRARVARVNDSFTAAIEEAGYEGSYRAVYPIKVNQLHEVVEEILDAGRPYRMGLECGSKAELVAALPHLEDDEMLLVCNGVKDDHMLGLMLSAQQLGRNVVPVMEKYDEFDRLLALAAARGLEPRMGVRVRLDTSGSGRWAESGSELSKFGLSVPEIVRMLERLRAEGRADSLVLLHFHIGSQIADVQVVREAVREIAEIYAQLVKRGVRPRYLDVGGGLGVNYDAGYSDEEGGINYSLREYANAVVFAVKEVCDAEEVPPPVLVSESGRAMTAHHSVLIVEVQDVHRRDRVGDEIELPKDCHSLVRDLARTLAWVGEERAAAGDAKVSPMLEAYHDAAGAKEQADALFRYGYLGIEEKALVERLYWRVCLGIHAQLEGVDRQEMPAELRLLDELLVDQYLCNFSVFQSILDHWAIAQRFPIMPLARLDEAPTRRGALVDLTCDSDGKVSRYVSSIEDKRYLPLHEPLPGERYRLGFFLMGAYQDIMGDAHNLFGRVPEAHVYADDEEAEGYYVEKIIPGASVEQMLAAVQYFRNDLERRMGEIVRQKTEAGVIRARAGVDLREQYAALFAAGTYLDNSRG